MAFGKPARRHTDDDQRIMPLINVVFLLLIFFMVAGQLSKTDPVKIEPPQSLSENEPGERIVQLLITSEGRLLISGEDVERTDIVSKLTSVLKNNVDKTVYVKADGNAEAAGVIQVLEQIKSAGAEKVKLLTSARREP